MRNGKEGMIQAVYTLINPTSLVYNRIKQILSELIIEDMAESEAKM